MDDCDGDVGVVGDNDSWVARRSRLDDCRRVCATLTFLRWAAHFAGWVTQVGILWRIRLVTKNEKQSTKASSATHGWGPKEKSLAAA